MANGLTRNEIKIYFPRRLLEMGDSVIRMIGKARLIEIILFSFILFPGYLIAQVNYGLSDFEPEDLTMGIPDQQLEILMTVNSTSDSLNLVRIVAPLSDTLSSSSAGYSAIGGNPSSWAVAISSSRDTVTYTPDAPILPGDVVTFRLTVANVASRSGDLSQDWSFEARDHDEDLWAIQSRQTTDRALEILDIRFVPSGADDGSASAAQTLDSVLVELTNHSTGAITLEPLDTRIFGDAFSSIGTEGSMPTLSAAASDTENVSYTNATVTSSSGSKIASATAGDASVPAIRTHRETLFIQEPGSLSIISVSTQPIAVSRGQQSISVDMLVENRGDAAVLIDSSELRFVLNGANRDSDYLVSFVPGVDTILGSQTRTLEFEVDVQGTAETGIVEVNGRVWGRDVNSESETSDTTATIPDSFEVQTKAQLEVQKILAAEDTVSRGEENVSVLMVIQNSGEADAELDSSSLRFIADGIGVDNDYSTILLTPLTTLSGNGTDTLDYLVDVDSFATLDSVTVHGRIFGRDANSDEATLDTTALQPDTWVVEASAELVCSLWAVPDTVIIGQTITLSMRVDNTGGAYADNVVPSITKLGNGTVSLVSGPTPPSANIGPGSNTVFNWVFTAQSVRWVYWRGDAAGEDHNSGLPVISPEDTSNQIYV